jgi:predicted DNA-binding antitoxin AbrB/MazE fold protein
MTFTVEATYENGMLRPAQPLPLRERERVDLVIRTPQGLSEMSPAPPANVRHEALQRLRAMNLPVADWEQMEQEIVRGGVE